MKATKTNKAAQAVLMPMSEKEMIRWVKDMLSCGQWTEIRGEMVEVKKIKTLPNGLSITTSTNETFQLRLVKE